MFTYYNLREQGQSRANRGEYEFSNTMSNIFLVLFYDKACETRTEIKHHMTQNKT